MQCNQDSHLMTNSNEWILVKNAVNYGWEPRRVLDQLTDIYLHLDSEVFANALAADERSFRFELFEDAANRLERALIKSPVQVSTIFSPFFLGFFKLINK